MDKQRLQSVPRRMYTRSYPVHSNDELPCGNFFGLHHNQQQSCHRFLICITSKSNLPSELNLILQNSPSLSTCQHFHPNPVFLSYIMDSLLSQQLINPLTIREAVHRNPHKIVGSSVVPATRSPTFVSWTCHHLMLTYSWLQGWLTCYVTWQDSAGAQHLVINSQGIPTSCNQPPPGWWL